MSNDPEHLLEHLMAIRVDIADIRSDLRKNTNRLGRIALAIAGLRRHKDRRYTPDALLAQGDPSYECVKDTR